jgi:dipeptidyl-peptidase-4
MTRKTILVAIVIIIILSWISVPLESKSNLQKVREANFNLARQFTENKMREILKDTTISPDWISGSQRFWYRFKTLKETKFIQVDPVIRSKIPLFDRNHLAQELSRITKKPVDCQNLPISGVTFDESAKMVRFSMENRIFKYYLAVRQLKEELNPGKEMEPLSTDSCSPDGSLAAYARNHNLWIRESGGNKSEIQLTGDGAIYYGFELSDYDYVDAEKQNPDLPVEAFVLWSPDSQRFVSLRTDARSLQHMQVMNSLTQPRPGIISYKVSLPGEPLRKYEVWVYNHQLEKMIRIKAENWPYQEYMDFTWSLDSSRMYMTRKSKDQLKCDLVSVNPETGETKVLIRERNAGMILTQPVVELTAHQGLIWWSRRDGYGNYFLYDTQGHLKKQITRGRFNAIQILHVDPNERTFLFLANGDNGDGNPYYIHLYKAGIDDDTLLRLTLEEADHRIDLAPDNSCFIDNFSSPEMAPRSILKDMDGKKIMDLESADTSGLIQSGWKMPSVFREKAADDRSDIWGIMWKPFDWKPDKLYPVITFVYPGPQDEFVPWQFFGRLENAHLAQYGFIVLMFGNRGGSQVRSLEYSEQYRGNLRDFGIDDKKAVIKKLAGKHPSMDLERIGIWGGSSGGFMTVTAMLLYPEFFKVGVSRSGIQDPGLMYRWWGDSFQGMREARDENGDIKLESVKVPSNLEIARNLKGRLLLIQGEADTIVHPANSMRLADILMKLNKRFDFILVPGGGHDASPHWPYIKNRVWLYFIEHLMGDHRYLDRIDLSEFMGESE